MCGPRRDDAIRDGVIASMRKLCIAQREISQARRAARYPGCHRTWLKTVESLANPLGSLQVRLQAAAWSVTERASELGVLLVHYK